MDSRSVAWYFPDPDMVRLVPYTNPQIQSLAVWVATHIEKHVEDMGWETRMQFCCDLVDHIDWMRANGDPAADEFPANINADFMVTLVTEMMSVHRGTGELVNLSMRLRRELDRMPMIRAFWFMIGSTVGSLLTYLGLHLGGLL